METRTEEEGRIVETQADEELTLDKKIEAQLNAILTSNDQVAAILSPPEYMDEMEKVLAVLKERSPAYAASLERITITEDSQEGLTEPIVLGLRHLSASFLSERFSAFIDWLQSEYAASMGLQSIPLVPRIEELRMLFLLDAWLVWRARETAKRPAPAIWQPGEEKVRI